MDNNNQLYIIRLPHPGVPTNRLDEMGCAYVGTQKEIYQFVNRLAKSNDACRYQDFLERVRRYAIGDDTPLEDEFVHIPPLQPVKEIGRKEYTLEDHKWIYRSPITGYEYLMKADLVWVSYVIIKEHWNVVRYEKAMFENLSVSMPGIGWVRNIESGGTPGVTYVEYNQPDDSYTTHMSLYRRGVVYEECRSPSYAMGRLPSMASIRLSTSLQEIAGQL